MAGFRLTCVAAARGTADHWYRSATPSRLTRQRDAANAAPLRVCAESSTVRASEVLTFSLQPEPKSLNFLRGTPLAKSMVTSGTAWWKLPSREGEPMKTIAQSKEAIKTQGA